MRWMFPLLLMAGPAAAHDGGGVAGWDMLTLAMLVLAGGLYASGTAALWRKAGRWRGVTRLRIGFFASGLALVAGLLLSPIDTLADRFLSAHMIQHLGLMLIAAPLLILGRPGLAILWALPAEWRPSLAGGPLRTLFQPLVHPGSAWLVYLLALWFWHVPALHEAALRNEALHLAQHLSFLLAALFFWTAVIEPVRGEGRARTLLAVFGTAIQSCALAALLTTSQVLWYPAYAGGIRGLSALEDQQLAGLIMWVPCCAILIGAAVATVAGLLRDAEARTERYSS